VLYLGFRSDKFVYDFTKGGMKELLVDPIKVHLAQGVLDPNLE
jgi:hypothetical protein